MDNDEERRNAIAEKFKLLTREASLRHSRTQWLSTITTPHDWQNDRDRMSDWHKSRDRVGFYSADYLAHNVNGHGTADQRFQSQRLRKRAGDINEILTNHVGEAPEMVDRRLHVLRTTQRETIHSPFRNPNEPDVNLRALADRLNRGPVVDYLMAREINGPSQGTGHRGNLRQSFTEESAGKLVTAINKFHTQMRKHDFSGLFPPRPGTVESRIENNPAALDAEIKRLNLRIDSGTPDRALNRFERDRRELWDAVRERADIHQSGGEAHRSGRHHHEPHGREL